ncbi:MAG TPA: SIS domain-containing protein [Bacillota bacterium]|nr:SIS domain-containing protein [Bacillota bacterium]
MDFKEKYDIILSEVHNACNAVKPEDVEELVKAIIDSRKVFLIGVGRVALSLMAFTKRLNHLGISAFFVGELNEPAITNNDLLIVGSGSGESAIPLQITRIAKSYNARIAHIGSSPESCMKQYTDLFIRVPVRTKFALPDELPSQQIMTSLFEQSLYVICDCIAMMICEEKKLDMAALWQYHANLE